MESGTQAMSMLSRVHTRVEYAMSSTRLNTNLESCTIIAPNLTIVVDRPSLQTSRTFANDSCAYWFGTYLVQLQ